MLARLPLPNSSVQLFPKIGFPSLLGTPHPMLVITNPLGASRITSRLPTIRQLASRLSVIISPDGYSCNSANKERCVLQGA